MTFESLTRCTPDSKCGHDTLGCETDEDCNSGHECVGTGTGRKCMDIDECNDQRFSADTLAYCGQYTNCNNNHGSYSCDCFTGTELVVSGKIDHKPYQDRKQLSITEDLFQYKSANQETKKPQKEFSIGVLINKKVATESSYPIQINQTHNHL